MSNELNEYEEDSIKIDAITDIKSEL